MAAIEPGDPRESDPVAEATSPPARQRWEYFVAWVYRNETVRSPYGNRGETAPTWCSDLEGQPYVLRDFMTTMGEQGWEAVTAVHSYTWTLSARSNGADTYPSHMLYFKRPKL